MTKNKRYWLNMTLITLLSLNSFCESIHALPSFKHEFFTRTTALNTIYVALGLSGIYLFTKGVDKDKPTQLKLGLSVVFVSYLLLSYTNVSAKNI